MLNQCSPYEKLYGHKPNLQDLRVFGCLVYASTIKAKRGKLDPRAMKCIFIGFKEGTRGYILYNLDNRNIFLSRDVHFYERRFPYVGNSLSPTNSLTGQSREHSTAWSDDSLHNMFGNTHQVDSLHGGQHSDNDNTMSSPFPMDTTEEQLEDNEASFEIPSHDQQEDDNELSPDVIPQDIAEIEEITHDEENIITSKRIRGPPVHL